VKRLFTSWERRDGLRSAIGGLGTGAPGPEGGPALGAPRSTPFNGGGLPVPTNNKPSVATAGAFAGTVMGLSYAVGLGGSLVEGDAFAAVPSQLCVASCAWHDLRGCGRGVPALWQTPITSRPNPIQNSARLSPPYIIASLPPESRANEAVGMRDLVRSNP
jgi:hypothetical protein